LLRYLRTGTYLSWKLFFQIDLKLQRSDECLLQRVVAVSATKNPELNRKNPELLLP
jgi:hypothetical protein